MSSATKTETSVKQTKDPIPWPHGRAMLCLLWVPHIKMITRYWEYTLDLTNLPQIQCEWFQCGWRRWSQRGVLQGDRLGLQFCGLGRVHQGVIGNDKDPVHHARHETLHLILVALGNIPTMLYTGHGIIALLHKALKTTKAKVKRSRSHTEAWIKWPTIYRLHF